MKYNTDRSFRLTQELQKQCRDYFENDPKIRQLTNRANSLQQQGHFREAMQVRQYKETLFSRVIVEYEQQIEQQVEEVKLSTVDIPQGDLEEIERLMVTLFMAIDIMDSCLMDINDALHRTDMALSFEKMDDLHEMAQMCREQLTQFSAKQNYHKYEHWGDITDNMYEMMQRKAKSIIRKTKTQEKRNKQ